MKPLAQLAAEYAAAKDAEIAAIDNRRRIAAQIQSFTHHESESSKTYAADGWKVSVKAPLIHSMNWDMWEMVKQSIPPHLWPVAMKPSLDREGLDWLKENQVGYYLLVADCITTKPGAVQISVKAVAIEEVA